jgi:probable F420-dependent oxidoreductase
VLDTDADRARATGRERVRTYLGLVNYTNNLRRLGWGDDDLSGVGSDALIDALVARGSAGEVAAQLTEHLTAGADHVAIQVLTAPGADLLDAYRELAHALEL